MDTEQQPDIEDRQQDPLPWYRNPTSSHPYWLYKKFALNEQEPEAFRTVAFFPWDDDSLQTLWDGSLAKEEENIVKWKGVLDKFRDAIAVGADSKVFIVWMKRRKHPLVIKIPETPEVRLIHADTTNVAWALSKNAIEEPLLIFSRASLLWIYNPVRKGLAGYLRGHGGPITSLTVHPSIPNLFCSTSRDHSARIYDLTLTPHQGHRDRQVNPHWPPGTMPSRAGAPHGLHMNEPEGTGIGRCIIVLMGARSGGHAAAVLNASFHPEYPIIATCGVDRCVKIWHVHPRNKEQITREDKPLFSSSRIHRSRVLSVRWLSRDILISHSPSAILRDDPITLMLPDSNAILRDDPNDIQYRSTHLAPGEMVVWRWLALDRFFPPLYKNMRANGQTQGVLRGCASDYQESASFTMMASATFPDLRLQLISPVANLYQSQTHDPLVLCVIPSGLPFWRHKEDKKQQTAQDSQTSTQAAEDVNTTSETSKGKGQGKTARTQHQSGSGAVDVNPEPQAGAPENMNMSPKGPVSLLPPDEPPPLIRILRDGKVEKYAGTVTLVHVPSLPIQIPPRFPLDNPGPTTGTTPSADMEEKLPGISQLNPGLVERSTPPPITGWALDVPLDEQDLIFESSPGSNSKAGDAMEVDSPTHTNEGSDTNQRASRRKEKGKEKESDEVKGTETDPIRVRVQTAAMGMNGKVIVVLGTRGRIWVYRVKNS